MSDSFMFIQCTLLLKFVIKLNGQSSVFYEIKCTVDKCSWHPMKLDICKLHGYTVRQMM